MPKFRKLVLRIKGPVMTSVIIVQACQGRLIPFTREKGMEKKFPFAKGREGRGKGKF